MFAKQSKSTTHARQSAADRSRVSKVSIGFMTVLGLAALLVLFVSQFGAYSGDEFSPERFSRRRFSCFRLPLIDYQLTPAVRSNTTGSLELYLQRNGYVPPAGPNEPVTWDMIRYGTVNDPEWSGDAMMLCSYLDLKDDSGNLIWHEWTKDNPDLAKILWPTVVKLARQDEYYLIPELMVLGISATDVQRFQDAVNEHLNHSYLQRARAKAQLGKHQAAADLFKRILTSNPKHNGALVGLERANRSLGLPASAGAAQE